jgi:probable rRNA maturation factor
MGVVDARNNRKRRNNLIVCFGSRANVPGNPPGSIDIYNEQANIPNLDQDALRNTIRRISQLIGYETYDVTLLLVEDEEMRETNLESRNIDAPTDILSFPFLEAQQPGTLVKPQFDIREYYNLGDMVVDVPYVIRRCQEDQEDNGDDDEEEYEIVEVDNPEDYEDDKERGVSGAMATVYDPEKRIHMLMVHGMLHLVGYDHEEDDDYELMVTREEEILKELGLLPPAMAEDTVEKP